jgi:threonine aldolase
LREIPGIELERDLIKTNIVFFDLDPRLNVDAVHLAKTLREKHGIWLGADGPARIRAVTHYWVGEAEVDLLLNKLRELVQF